MSTDKADKKKKAKKPARAKRFERRFIANSSYSPWLVKVLGAIGAAALGAGVWGYLYGHAFDGNEKAKQIPAYLIAAGAIVTGAAIWLGTAAETPLRVGDPGIAMERGEVRRMPWWAVAQLTWESGTMCLVVAGKDESGTSWTFRVPVKAHPDAVAWILEEALERVPKVVEIKDDVLDKLPRANPHAGMKIELEPLQVVGKKCAASGKLISYEPDARTCLRCERVYFKRSVPKKCKCGNSLVHLRGSVGQDDDDDDDDERDDDDHEGERVSTKETAVDEAEST